MKIFVFGNEDIPFDSLPLRILPQLKKLYPKIEFEVKDPNEEWELNNDKSVTIIDTALGINAVTVFLDLNKFARPPSIGMHDFDALTNLRFLMKLGKINKVTIIAVPSEIDENKAIKDISNFLEEI